MATARGLRPRDAKLDLTPEATLVGKQSRLLNIKT
jgi:hypothetical protein